jgi:tetracycline 7-halogenase / FADH2 O2-dependent halogenase
MTRDGPYDVAILGTGLGGTLLGAVLARHGVRVLLIDSGTHPRFAIGESTISYTSLMMDIISARYDVPEIGYMSSFDKVQRYVAPSSGLKRNFGFVHHREGQGQDPRHVNQFVIPRSMHYENHLFRQDIDAFMLHVVVRYGATVVQRTTITEIEIDDAGVTLAAEDGRSFRARYLVDASGQASPLATRYGLRENPCRFKHHARSLFTHMIDVKRYDDVGSRAASRRHQNPVPWYQGTLHHIFHGGWIWVIPFNNHRRACNPLVSVGLTVDPRVHQRPAGMTPAEEFRECVSRFPDIQLQFTDAKSVREWTSTGDRMQYSSKAVVGDRYCLTSHAAGFLDPLYSRGLTNTLEATNVLGRRLIDAVKQDDFSAERFADVERIQQSILDFNDSLVYSSYLAFKEFPLWNAAFRIWAIVNVVGTFMLQDALSTYGATRNPGVFDDLELSGATGMQLPRHEGFMRLVRETERVLELQAEGRMSSGQAVDSMFEMLQDADFVPPLFSFRDRGVRFYHPTIPKVIRMLLWSQFGAPRDVGPMVRNAMRGFALRKLTHRLRPG